LPVMGPIVRHRVIPYESLLSSRVLSRLAAAEARIVDLESALREADQNATRDPLTGAFNRRGMNEVFAREAAHAQRTAQPLALALIDLDDFKSINDKYGHAVGDIALVQFARVITETLRPTDLCCRWSGGEFVVVMPGAGRVFAKRALARVQAAITAQPVAAMPVPLTFSTGVAVSQNSESLERTLARANRAVHRAKTGGK